MQVSCLIIFTSCLAIGHGLGFTETLRDGFLRLHHRLTSSSEHHLHKRAIEIFEEIHDDSADIKDEKDILEKDVGKIEIVVNKTRKVGYAKMEFVACGEEENTLYVDKFQAIPNPTVIPGTMNFVFHLIARENTSAPIGAQLIIRKKVNLLFGLSSWFDIPCLDFPEGKIGSCEYENACPNELFTQGICTNKDDLSTCGCPVIEGEYDSQPIKFEIPQIPDDIPPYLLAGEFYVKGTLKKNDKIISCYSANVDLLIKDELIENK